MLSLLLSWIISAAILLLISRFIPGISISGLGIALVVVLVLGILNVLIKPFLILLTLPINILTLGLFSFVINAAIFAIAAWLIPGFEVSNFLSALVGSLLLSLSNVLIHSLTSKPHTIL